jgi:ArsR family transcriptional regulator, arsenate/arsenite/antimonite-responsive transcriptional repressor
MDLACRQFFHLLSDDTRLRSVLLIRQEGELCVCELVHALGEIQPKVSRHLALLRDHDVVADRRAGQWIYYRIHPALPAWAGEVIDTTVVETAMQEPYIRDLADLGRMPNRPGGEVCAQ